MKLVTVGDVMVDVVSDQLPAAGERKHGTVRLRAGGSAVNAALVAVQLGAAAQVVGRIGRDAAGDLVLSTLAGHGVDGRLMRDDELPTGTAVALQDAIVAHRGANAHLAPDDLPVPLGGDALLVSGFALFQRGSREAARAALERFDGPWTAVDLASPRLASLDFEARVVFATEEEAGAVRGFEQLFEIVCIKNAAGARVHTADATIDAASSPVSETDQFGGGDAFAAAFLVSLSEGAALDEALERACAAGAAAAAG